MNGKQRKITAAEKDLARKDDPTLDEERLDKAAHEAKVQKLKAKAREIVERVLEEQRKRGRPKK